MSKPPRRRLDIEDVGDITVVRFVDKRILDEQNVMLIRLELFALVDVEKRRKIVLDFGNVELLSSAAHGLFFALQRKMMAARGALALCNIDPTVFKTFKIIKVDILYRICRDKQEALAQLAANPGNDVFVANPGNDVFVANPGNNVFVACPVTGCAGRGRTTSRQAGGEVNFHCPECDAGFQAAIPLLPPGGEAEAAVGAVGLLTDGAWSVRIVVGRPSAVQVGRRLDLFAADALRRLWPSLPPPRFAVIDCRQTTELSEHGLAALTEVLAGVGEGGKAVLLVVKDRPAKGAAFPPELPLFTDEPAAVRALGEIPAEAGSPITVKVVRPRES
jgi:anti-sigma B factor antagonist